MTNLPTAPRAAAISQFDARAEVLLAAARLLFPSLEQGTKIDTGMLRGAMQTAFGGSDADGAWDWKLAYEAGEAAQVLFLRRFGPAMLHRGSSPDRTLAMIERVAALLPSHTRRSEA
ncbi:MAG TPA: helicase, partial [Sphingomonas sp.]|nr:helicase [Sphingomonas sp.]